MNPASEEGFETLAPPVRGEWRSLFSEPEQTLKHYAARWKGRPRAGQRAIYLEPLGEAPLPEFLPEYAEAFFQVPVRVLPARPLLGAAHVLPRDQHNSSMLLGELAGRVPGDALALVGICDLDLFARGKRYVFGEGSFEHQAGIQSLARLGAPEGPLYRRRAVRLLSHEIGHILGIEHCVTHRCVMQGSNTLPESDRQPLHLCPGDLQKLESSLGFDRAKRYRALRDLYDRLGLADEAAWVAARLSG